MISKNKAVFLFFFSVVFSAFSQHSEHVDNIPTFDERKIHYGFYLGLNQNDYKVQLEEGTIPNADISVEPKTGFNVGLLIDYRLHKNINLRFEPGLVSNTKNILFNHLKLSTSPQDSIREVGSTYLHIPLVLKFSTDRYRNIRPYVLGGISYDHNLSSNENNQDDNSSGQFRTTTSNLMYEVGVGIDIYLPFFKFSPSIRGVFAINNELIYDRDINSQWTSPINNLATRGVFLTFSFE